MKEIPPALDRAARDPSSGETGGSATGRTEEATIVIVGAGFAGLGMAIRLKQAGIDDFVVLEGAAEVGGTWRDNAYPGAACDVESHLYSFSFAPNPGFSRSFARQGEILDYLVRCAEAFGVRPHIRFRSQVERAVFDEASACWRIDARIDPPIEAGRREARQTYVARTLVLACGGLSRPALPDIAGIGDFRGPIFHSARWNHDAPLDGRRVAVIGTGASAIQIVPAIAPRVARLHVFQRTPPWIMPKRDRTLGPAETERLARLPALHRALRYAIYWRNEALALGFVVEPRLLQAAERLARRYLERSVPDPALRAKLLPDYRMGCKRILPSSDYYPAIQRENVELVTEPIARISAGGVVTASAGGEAERTGETERSVDAIVLATGFQAAEQVAPFEIVGAAGRRLDEAWQSGAEAYLGTAVTGFPNLFVLVGPNTGLGHSSMILMIESQVAHVLSAIRTLRAEGIRRVEVRSDLQARYNERLHARLARTVWATGCHSWYRTRSGKNTTLWPGFTFEFRWRTRRFDPRDYVLTRETRQGV